ncbi:MAG: DUF4209 domain-containing protein [Rhabdochlamydiaceae bacterium]|nr:DUF4209 domain-containing protein [Rhabdochlamydiaceae bacterium]
MTEQNTTVKNLAPLLQDFHNANCNEILATVSSYGYWPRQQALLNASKLVSQENHTKILELLGHICSMALEPQNHSHPFAAAILTRKGRSAELTDFSDEEIDLLANILNEVSDPWVKGRLADIAWLRKKPRDIKLALKAIDSYKQIPINLDTFSNDGGEIWMRGLYLASSLGKSTKTYLNELTSRLTEALIDSEIKDGFLALWVAQLLRRFQIGKSQSKEIANHLEQLGRTFGQNKDYYSEQEYFLEAAIWNEQSNNDTKFAELTALAAESMVSQAEALPDKKKALAGMYWVEKAFQLYRTIPQKFRNPTRPDELIVLLTKFKKASVEEMVEVRTDVVDITEIAQKAQSQVLGKSAFEALLILANISPLVDQRTLKEKAIQYLDRYLYRAFASVTTLTKDGRVIQREPSLNPNEPSASQEDRILAEMLIDFKIHISVTVEALVLPALENIQLEHLLTESDFIELAKKSPLVPRDRCLLFGKGLYAGYKGDFSIAVHILSPQIENMIRNHFKLAGTNTVTFDSKGKGIETEDSLNTLIKLPIANKLLGENLAFVIENLFCIPGGPNLRNQVAHGLLDDSDACSTPCIYAWWLALRLVLNSSITWETQRDVGQTQEASQN